MVSLREQVLRAVHYDVHGGELATHNRLKLEAWWPGFCRDVESCVRRCEFCDEQNAEFCDEELCKWLRKIGCQAMKTTPYYPRSNGIAERMVQTTKRGICANMPERGSFYAFLTRLLLSYHIVPHGNRSCSPSAMMGRQIRSPTTHDFAPDSLVRYRATYRHHPEPAQYVTQAGQNTAIVLRGSCERPTLAHMDQLKGRVADAGNEKGTEDSTRMRNCRRHVLRKMYQLRKFGNQTVFGRCPTMRNIRQLEFPRDQPKVYLQIYSPLLSEGRCAPVN